MYARTLANLSTWIVVVAASLVAPSASGQVWSTAHNFPGHKIDMEQFSASGVETLKIKYDDTPVGELSLTFANGVFTDLSFPETPSDFFPYMLPDFEVVIAVFWKLDPAISPIYLAISPNQALLPAKATLNTAANGLFIGLVSGELPPTPAGGWGGTDPCTGHGNPGWPGDHSDNPYAPNGGPGGNGSGDGIGGPGGNGTGNGSGGAGGNGAGNANGGRGGRGAGTGNGGGGGNSSSGTGGNGGHGGNGTGGGTRGSG